MITKRIEYSYPTSPNAKQLGFYKTGCYSVEVGEVHKPKKAIAGFSTLEEAKQYAEKMPEMWDNYTR